MCQSSLRIYTMTGIKPRYQTLDLFIMIEISSVKLICQIIPLIPEVEHVPQALQFLKSFVF